ncbi:MAG: arsenate reductase ArsC [Steroidobacteraceae bacterium]
MSAHPYNVLFLCTGNSARSIMAESLLRHWGKDEFVAYSAGSYPKGEVHPMTLELLERMKFPTEGLRSKSWDEFIASTAPEMDFVITVCDDAAGETCPIWPGQPMTAHWGVADPTKVQGTERDKLFAFRRALMELENRIKVFANLPLRSLDKIKIRHQMNAIADISIIPKM